MARESKVGTYQVVTGCSVDSLVERVNTLVVAGWRPIGGFSIIEDTHNSEGKERIVCYQAMQKVRLKTQPPPKIG